MSLKTCEAFRPVTLAIPSEESGAFLSRKTISDRYSFSSISSLYNFSKYSLAKNSLYASSDLNGALILSLSTSLI
jgi:hypothetical protein